MMETCLDNHWIVCYDEIDFGLGEEFNGYGFVGC